MDALMGFLEKKSTQLVPDLEFFAPIGEPPAPPDKHRMLKRVEPVDVTEVNQTTVSLARKNIEGEIMTYLNTTDPDYMLLVRAAAGVGKTWLGVAAANWVATTLSRRVFYAGARHDFYKDVKNAVEGQRYNPLLWYEWLPRQSVGEKDSHTYTCLHTESANAWLHRGYSGIDFCKAACGFHYMNKLCPYHAQKRRPEPITFGQHQHVTLGHPLMGEFYCVIGDEMPLGAFLNKWIIPKKHIYRDEMPWDEPLTEILYEMRDLCMDGVNLSGRELLLRLGGAERVHDACKLYNVPPGVYIPHVNAKDADEVRSLPFHYLPAFVPLLMREAAAAMKDGEDYLARIYLTEHGLTMACRYHTVDTLPKHVIWFDATGNPEVYEQMFGRKVKVVDARPNMVGRVIQITDRANGKSVVVSTHDEIGNPDPSAAIKKQTLELVKHICSRHKTPAIITFKGARDYFEQGTGAICMHFYANRGSNALEDCDAVIVIGTPQPSIVEIVEIAKSLWYDRMKTFDNRWIETRRVYRYVDGDGDSWEYAASEYADPVLNLVLQQSRESEIVQAANRARIVTRPNTVYLLSNVPIGELPPNELTNARKLSGAPDELDAYVWIEFLNKIQWILDVDSKNHVTVQDLRKHIGMSAEVAEQYIDYLARHNKYQKAAALRV